MSLEDMHHAAIIRGDTKEAQRLARLLERLDSQRQAYGRAQRAEAASWNG